jgi:hypothetical protein
MVRIRRAQLHGHQRLPFPRRTVTHLGPTAITKVRLALAADHMITPGALVHARPAPGARPREALEPAPVRLILLPLLDHPGQLFPPIPALERGALRRLGRQGHVFREE